MIEEQEIIRILQKGLFSEVICKEFVLKPTEMAKLVAATVNSGGGYIFIGITNENNHYRVNGVSNTINFSNAFKKALDLLQPIPQAETKFMCIEGKWVYIIKAYKRNLKVYLDEDLLIRENGEAVKSTNKKPVIFLSYSWDNDGHKKWVKNLSRQLQSYGIQTILDQDDLILGDSLPLFMEQSITNSDYVLIICTPTYKTKADIRKGGVGYEESIITSDVLLNQNHRKYITVLSSGSWVDSTPVWAQGKYGVDLSAQPIYDKNEFTKLVETILAFKI